MELFSIALYWTGHEFFFSKTFILFTKTFFVGNKINFHFLEKIFFDHPSKWMGHFLILNQKLEMKEIYLAR